MAIRLNGFRACWIALIPGQAEKFERIAEGLGLNGRAEQFRQMQWERNGVYVGVAMMAIGLIGLSFSVNLLSTPLVVGVVGIGLAIIYGIRLYKVTSIFLREVNDEIDREIQQFQNLNLAIPM